MQRPAGPCTTVRCVARCSTLATDAGADVRAGPMPNGTAARTADGQPATRHNLHAFVDRSTVEAFWDNRTTVSAHVWPAEESSDRLALYLECGPGGGCEATVVIELWKLQGIFGSNGRKALKSDDAPGDCSFGGWTDERQQLLGGVVLLCWPLSALATETVCRYSEGRAARLRSEGKARGEPPEALDVGVSLFGTRMYHQTHLPDLAQAMLTCWLAAALWTRGGPASRPFALLVRFAATHAALLWLRCFSIASTVTGLACPNYSVKGGEAGGLNGGRHDLMFSGHTAIGTLLAASTAHVLRHGHPAWVWAVWLAAAANSALQVAVGDHYTADVLVANYVTIPLALLVLQTEQCY